MIHGKQFYENIPYFAREELREAFMIKADSEKILKFISSNLPEDDGNIDVAMQDNNELYKSLCQQLIEEFEEYVKEKEKEKAEARKKTKNFEQNRKKAMALKSDQLIKVKEPCYCSGLGFFKILEVLARQGLYKITIPETIICGFTQSPVLLQTDKSGILKAIELEWEKLLQEIKRIHENFGILTHPASALKYEIYNNEGIKLKSEVILFKLNESNEVHSKIHNLSYGNNFIVLQEYIRPKIGTISKIRVQFAGKIEKAYRIHNRVQVKVKKKEFDEKNSSGDFRTKKQSIAYSSLGMSGKNHFENREKIKKVVEICDFFVQIVDYLDVGEGGKMRAIVKYFNKKKNKLIKKLEYPTRSRYLRNQTLMEPSQETRVKLFNNYTATLTDKDPDVYLVTNISSLAPLSETIGEIIKSSKSNMKKNQKITEIVLDFVENDKNVYYLIKVQHVKIEEKLSRQIPKWKQFRHVSLFSITEGSSVKNNKKQQLCCGDYCNLLKKHDLKTSEKIEVLLKATPEYSKALVKLQQIQDFLNLDSAQSLFNLGNQTIISQNMQYKTIRKNILEDRNDPDSLKNVVLELPEKILQELGIPLTKGPNQKTLHHINQKISWEQELVPVCNMCYKIYSIKKKNLQGKKKNIEKIDLIGKFWKVDECKYKIKPQKRQAKYFVDYHKMLENLNFSCSEISLNQIRGKILKSDFVSNKILLQPLATTESENSVILPLPYPPTISSSLIDTVCARLDEIKMAKPHSRASASFLNFLRDYK